MPTFKIEYSESYDPIRFDESGENTIGTGSWSEIIPEDTTKISAIKITTDSSSILKPYERLIVEIKGFSPVGAEENATAYNSFALKADKITEEGIIPLLPTEPNKVSVRIRPNRFSSIGGFVFEDVNQDGIYNEDEPNINGVIVELYDSNMNFIKSTVTANNSLGEKGYYLFSKLVEGEYFVKFIPPTEFILTNEKTSEENGSKADPLTGFTDKITVQRNEAVTDIIAGIYKEKEKEPEKISAWKQFLIDGEIIIPKCSSEIENLISSSSEIFVTDFEVVKTPVTNKNFEGIISTGYKLILKGKLEVTAEYSDKNSVNHSTLLEIAFYSYIVLPKNYQSGNSIETNVILEDFSLYKLSENSFYVKAVAFAYAKIGCGLNKI